MTLKFIIVLSSGFGILGLNKLYGHQSLGIGCRGAFALAHLIVVFG